MGAFSPVVRLSAEKSAALKVVNIDQIFPEGVFTLKANCDFLL
jgi:hypothetical protein